MNHIIFKQLSRKTILTVLYSISFILVLFLTISNVNLLKNLQYAIGHKDCIVNGNFESGLDGWKYYNVIIKEIDGIKNAYIKGSNNKRNRLQQNIDVVSGRKYKLSFSLTGPNKGAFAGYRDDSIDKEQWLWCNGTNTNKTYVFEFVPKTSGKNIIYLAVGRQGDFYFSNISLELITNIWVTILTVLSTIVLFSFLAILTAFFFTKRRDCLAHYIVCAVILLIAVTGYNTTLSSLLLLTLILYFVLRIKWFVIIPLCLLVIWAFLKRFLFLGDKCFWWDEFLTESRVWFSPNQILEHAMTSRCLLYSFILKYYASLINYFDHKNFLTEFQLRLPHAIIGTLSLFIIYFIGKKLKDKVSGFLMAVFASFSSFLIFYAREARFYPFVLFFSVCIVHAVVLIINRDKDTKRYKILLYYIYYSLAAVCGMHTHQGFWLLFGASNIFLVLFEFTNIIFYSKEKKKDLLFLIPIFLLLVFPIATAYSGIVTLLGKGTDSNIIKAEKLVPRLDSAFFIKVHKELWGGIEFCEYMHIFVFFAAGIMLIFKKTRTISIYLLFVMVLTFLSLRNMGTFREPFRVKYITFMWLIEMIALVLAFDVLLYYFTSKISNVKVSKTIYFFLLSCLVIFSQKNLVRNIKLPTKSNEKESFRTIAEKINTNILSNDVITSFDEGVAALNYYKRVYSSNWKIISVDQIDSKYKGNYIYDGFVYCLFHKNSVKKYDNNIFVKLTTDRFNFSLFKSKNCLDTSVYNNLSVVLNDGLRLSNTIPIRRNVGHLYYGGNLIKNGSFTNNWNGWKLSIENNPDISVSVTTNDNRNCLNITNYYSKALVVSQTVSIPTGGLYALTFKTRGFEKSGHISIRSKDVKEDIYRMELMNCAFTRYHNLKFKGPQNVTINITIHSNVFANLTDMGLYRLVQEKQK